MPRVRRIRVVRRRRRSSGAPGGEQDNRPETNVQANAAARAFGSAQPSTNTAPPAPAGPSLYVAVPGNGQDAPGVVRVEANHEHRRAVLPIMGEPEQSNTIGVIGRPNFRNQLSAILKQTTQISVAFEKEGSVTPNLISEHPEVEIMLVDGESGQVMARRAPVMNREDVLAQVPVLLIADPEGFKPPNEIAVVVGGHWSVLLMTSAENPLRLTRAIRKAIAGKITLDAGIDKRLIRVANELSAERKALR